jgi:quercetin dioxygenase-like cupin family protein
MDQNLFKRLALALAAAMALGVVMLPFARSAGLTRTLLTREDVSVSGREAVVARVEIAPGGQAGRHTHPGDEISYVLEGEAVLLIDGQPPRHLKAGDSFVIAAGTIHDARNEGDVPTRVLGVYVVEKGKPLATPAPAAAASP